MTAPTQYSYQWYRNNTPISGAVGSTYTCSTADVGEVITCAVIGSNSAGTAAPITTAGTTAVLAAANAALPYNSVSPDFQDNFTYFNTGSNWYPCYPYQLSGKVDEGSQSSWNAGTAGGFTTSSFPFGIISDGSASDGSLLRVQCRRTTSSEMGAAGGKSWVGGIMISHVGWTGGYFEWRVRCPSAGNGPGMWPALWLYEMNESASEQNMASAQEIDVFEVFGNASASPWNSTMHYGSYSDPSGGYPNTQVPPGGTESDYSDTVGWHLYGVEWNGSSVLKCYYDRAVVHDFSSIAGEFNGIQMGARMNYTVTDDSGAGFPTTNSSTPSPLYFDVDYCWHFPYRPF